MKNRYDRWFRRLLTVIMSAALVTGSVASDVSMLTVHAAADEDTSIAMAGSTDDATEDTVRTAGDPGNSAETDTEDGNGSVAEEPSGEKMSEADRTDTEATEDSEADTEELSEDLTEPETVTEVEEQTGNEEKVDDIEMLGSSGKLIYEETTGWTNGNTYVAEGEIDINDTVTVNGYVELQLNEGAVLNCHKGIRVTSGNNLTISGKGELNVWAENDGSAAIGGYYGPFNDAGNIIIEGGNITTHGGTTGIGGANGNVSRVDGGNCGTVIIRGGKVTTNRIGGGSVQVRGATGGSGGSVYISGGEVNVSCDDTYAAAIGGGRSGSGGLVWIEGGKVTVESRKCAIGPGYGFDNGTYDGTPGEVRIIGGQVTLRSSESLGVWADHLVLGYGRDSEDCIDAPSFSYTTLETEKNLHYDCDGTDLGPVDEASLLFKAPELLIKPGKSLAAGITGSGTDTDPYIIHDTIDYMCFAKKQNTGEYVSADLFDHKYFKLADDFDNSNWPVTQAVGTYDGTDSHPFTHVFDGNGKTLYVNIVDESGTGTAPFRSIAGGAVIKDLTVEGNVRGGIHASGLVGYSNGGIPNHIENCVVNTHIEVPYEKNRNCHMGGVVGHVLSSKLTIEHTSFGGLMHNTKDYAGGFIGWCDQGAELTIEDCIFTGSYEGMAEFHPVAVKDGGKSVEVTTEAVYYMQDPSLTDKDHILADGIKVYADAAENIIYKEVTSCDENTYYAAAFLSGLDAVYNYTGDPVPITYTLSLSQEDELTEGTDYSVSVSSETVKEPGDYTLTVTGMGDYSGSMVVPFKVVDLQGNGVILDETCTSLEDGKTYYVTNNVTVKNRIIVGGNVSLILEGSSVLRAQSGIGVAAGNKLTISGQGSLLAVSNTINNAGIGGTASDCGEIHIKGGNITAIGGDYSAGIGAGARSGAGDDGCCKGGIITIDEGVINAAGGSYGSGIGGGASTSTTADNGSCGIITINGGVVTATGGICGNGIGGGACLVDDAYSGAGGSVTINGGAVTVVAGARGNGIGPGYYYSPRKPGASGTLTINLTNEDDFVSVGNIIASECIIGNGLVYYSGGENCGLVTAENLTSKDPGYIIRPGSFAGSGTEDDPYLISSEEEWELFADRINAGVNADACYKLSDDFDNSDKPVTTGAGTSEKPFKGVFDGNGRTVNTDIRDDSVNNLAPFCHIMGATIKNLTVSGHVSGNKHAAGLVGGIEGEGAENKCIIDNCVVRADVSGPSYIGGIIGHAGTADITISNSVYSGSMSNASNYAGGLIGWCDGGNFTIQNSLFKGEYLGSVLSRFHPIAAKPNNKSVTSNDLGAYYTADPGFTSGDNLVMPGTKVNPAAPEEGLYCKNSITGDEENAIVCYEDVNISGIEESYEFTGGPAEIDYVLTTEGGRELVENEDYEVSYSSSGISKVGDHSIIFTGTGKCGGSESCRFAINKAAAPELQDISLIRSVGEEQELSVCTSVACCMPNDAGELSYTTGTATVDSVSESEIEVSEYTVDDSGEISAGIINGRAGDVITLPVIISSENYNDASVNIVIRLDGRAEAEVSISEGTEIVRTYGDNSLALHASLANATDNGSWTWSSLNTSVASVTSADPAVGLVTIKGVGTVMICVRYESETFAGEGLVVIKVEPKMLEITWSETSFIYDGKSHIPSAELSRPIGDDDCTLVITGEAAAAGEHIARAELSGADKQNYRIADDDSEYGFTIGKADISGSEVSLGTELTFNGSQQTQTVSEVITPSGIKLPDSEYTIINNSVTNAGDHVLTIAASEDGNYTGSVNAGFSVGKKEIIPVIAISGSSTFTGSEVIPEYTVSDPDSGLILQSSDYDAAYMNNVNAGIGKITITESEHGNYKFNRRTRGFEIEQAVWEGKTEWTVGRKYLYTNGASDLIDLSEYLPAGRGETVYYTPVIQGEIAFTEEPEVNGNILTYKLSGSDKPEQGSIVIKATTQNYSNTFNVNIDITQQIVCLFEKVGRSNELCTYKKLTVGKKCTLTPLFVETGVVNKRVVWASTNPDVATVTQGGAVTARSAGNTVIQVLSEGYPGVIAECEVSVTEPVTGLSLDKSKYSFGTGESVSLSVSVLPYTAIQELTWTVSDPSVVKIYDEAGEEELTGEVAAGKTVMIKAVGKGSAKVTAAATDGSGKKAACKFTVGNPVPQNITIVGKGNKTSIVAGKTLTMAVNWGDKSKKPANTGLKWSVEKQGGGDAAAIATISSKGVLTGITAGTVTVKAVSTADPSRSGSVDITITPPTFRDPKVTGISFADTTLLQEKGLYAGKSYTVKTGLTLSGKGKAASGAVAWYSSDPSVASVSQKGVIKAVAPGSVTITAVTRDAENILTAPSASVSFNVYAAVKSVKIDKKKITIGTQEGSQYGKISVAAIQPYNVTDPSIKWSVNNGNVKLAAIDAGQAASGAEFESAAGEGVATAAGQALAVMGVTPGVTRLTGVTTDGSKKKVSCTITIRGQVTGLSLSPKGAKSGYNDITVTEDAGVYTGNMKAKSSLTLKPATDLNGISASSTDKADKAKYKLYKKYTDTSLSYRSSDTSVATVSNGGKVTVKNGVEAGRTCVIYISSADGVRTIQYKITVR